jgi:hypothetical protein
MSDEEIAGYMTAAMLMLLLALVLCLSGCAFDQSYSVAYSDEQGHTYRAGVTLHPRGYAK